MPVLVRDAGGTPVPPAEILTRLHRIHPALGLRYRAVEWVFTWEWPEHDPRWAWVQSGQQGPEAAYDSIGRLPLDCPIDQAAPYIERALRDYPVEDIRKLRERVNHYNSVELPKAQLAETLEATMGTLGTFAGANPLQSAGGLPSVESPGLAKKKAATRKK